MGHDAFARHGLGSAALMVISALHQPPTRRPASSSVPPRSPARPPTGPRNASPTTASSTAPGRPGPWRHGPWRALVTAILSLLLSPDAAPAQGWYEVAERHATKGVAARRNARPAAQRAAYREALERLAEHRSKAVVVLRDGRPVLVPARRPDEIPPAWHAPNGRVLDPVTGRPAADWRVATDGQDGSARCRSRCPGVVVERPGIGPECGRGAPRVSPPGWPRPGRVRRQDGDIAASVSAWVRRLAIAGAGPT